jgi:hypothetical protein
MVPSPGSPDFAGAQFRAHASLHFLVEQKFHRCLGDG